MDQAKFPPFQGPRVAPRWVRALEVIDGLFREKPEVREQLVAVIGDALASHDMGDLCAEQWLRVLLIQQTSGCDDEEMDFRLNDFRSVRAFCGLVDIYIPQATTYANLRRMDEATWNRIEPVLRTHLGAIWKKQYRARVAR